MWRMPKSLCVNDWVYAGRNLPESKTDQRVQMNNKKEYSRSR